jgi:MFS family permease
MTPSERRAGVGLACIFALRMLGLFLILPVFSVAAQKLPGGDNLTLVGIALGAYGLTQALFLIPFGMASDRLGRKPLIVFGLLLFAAGCFLAALANDIYFLIAGRILQGAGAISAVVTALAADLTREQHRTKIMAMIGSSIGLVFAGSLVVAPMLYALVGLHGMFVLTGLLSLAAIVVVTRVIPPAPAIVRPQQGAQAKKALLDPQLLRLNFGIFSLHMMQMAMFIVIPTALRTVGNLPLAEHWKVYLPTVLGSFVLMVPAIIYAERRGRMKQVFVAALALLLLTEIGFIFGRGSFAGLVLLVLSFFIAFNVLEAMLPSLVSRVAPIHLRGLALGVYNTTQAAGLFVGAGMGGYLAQNVGGDAVFMVCSAMALIWLLLAVSMRQPPLRKSLPAA